MSNFVGDAPSLESAVEALRDRISGVRIPLDADGAAEARWRQQQLLEQIEDHILPRLRRPDAPLLVVVGGSTGAGKSTLVNSLVGERLTATGVRRPTTRDPVLVCHPDDRSFFAGEHAKERTAGESEAAPAETEHLPAGIALLDTPDIDSVVESNRNLARRLIGAADLWLYVTTAARYADAVPWDLLHSAAERGTTLAVALNRMPRSGGGDVREHLARLLDERGFGQPELFAVPETTAEGGKLPAEAVKNVRNWLTELAGPRRPTVLRRAVEGLIEGLSGRVPDLAIQLERQIRAATELRDEVEACYAAAVAELDEKTRDGTLLRGEALIRWQDYVGTGELLRSLRARGSWLSSTLRRSAWTPPASGGEELRAALAGALAAEIRAGAHEAAAHTVARWEDHPAGRSLLAGTDSDLGEESASLADRARVAAESWQQHVIELVRNEGATKRSLARIISVDVEGLALVLMVGLFGYTAGDTASGDATVSRRLLAAVFGAESLRTIAEKARADLRERMGTVLDEEAVRFIQRLDAADVPDDDDVTQLYQAMYSLEVAG